MSNQITLPAVNDKVQQQLGMRVSVSELQKIKRGYSLSLTYSHQFNFAVGNTVVVKSIRFPDVYSEDFSSLADLHLPFYDIQHAVKREWNLLGASLYQETVEDYNIVNALLKINMPISFINPFMELITNLVIENKLSSDYVTHLRGKANGSKYIEITELNGFISKSDDEYVITDKFRRFLRDVSKDDEDCIRDAVAHIIVHQNHLIKDELQMNHLEAYLKIVSSLRWMARSVNKALSKEELFKFHCGLFDGRTFVDFCSKINTLLARTDLLIRNESLLQLNPEYA